MKIKKMLAADKRKHGVYDDSEGIRYLPPSLYIQMEDYSGGLKYLKWFENHFPDDSGMPDFLFEWTVLLFKCDRLREAERKLYQTFFSNTYLIDAFLGREITPIDKWESSNMELSVYTQYLNYGHEQPALTDFAIWLTELMNTREFKEITEKHIALHKKIKYERDPELRSNLIIQIRQLEMESGWL